MLSSILVQKNSTAEIIILVEDTVFFTYLILKKALGKKYN